MELNAETYQPADQLEESSPPLISVVLPCLNEAESVGLCVREAASALAQAGISAEVIVVDNGSSDGSGDIASSEGARVVSEAQPGYGSALLAGINAARGSVVVMADADFTYDLRDIPKLVAPVLEGEADLVIAERLAGATRSSMPLLHRFVGTPALSLLIRRSTGGLTLRDSQSGFRAFRTSAVRRLHLQSSGMEFASEMLIRSRQAGLRIHEIPTTYRERIGESKLNTFSDGRRHLRLILLLAPHLLLVWPGITFVALGTGLSVMSFLAPAGVTIGSLRWQPLFLSGILLVLGIQALLAGMVLANRSSVVRQSVARHYRFVEKPSFPSLCLLTGGIALGLGLLIDVGLFLVWSSGEDGLSRGPALASLAQSLIMGGGSLLAFGLIYPMVTRNLVASVPAYSVDPDPPGTSSDTSLTSAHPSGHNTESSNWRTTVAPPGNNQSPGST